MEITDRYTRCRVLFGENFKKIVDARVLILGVGGVGSFCVDGLYRTGVTNITMVDKDVFDVTNQNRQIGSESVGEIKVGRLAELYPGTIAIHQHINREWVEQFDFEPYDLVLDCIDDIDAKVSVAHKSHKKLISSLGAAKRIDPTQIEIDSIWRVQGDKFSRKFKESLKKSRFSRNFRAVYSTESARCIEKGSFVGVTGAFGLTMCSEAVSQLIAKEG